MIVTRSDEFDKVPLGLRKGKWAVKAFAFQIAVETCAKYDLVSFCQSIIQGLFVEESHLADGNRT